MSLSRIGKLPVAIPAGVTITVDSGDVVVKGPKGELKQFITPAVDVTVEDGQVTVHPKDESKTARSQHGLMRALINNMVIGVTQGFEKKLEVNGVGFRVSSSNNELEMALAEGYKKLLQYPLARFYRKRAERRQALHRHGRRGLQLRMVAGAEA